MDIGKKTKGVVKIVKPNIQRKKDKLHSIVKHMPWIIMIIFLQTENFYVMIREGWFIIIIWPIASLLKKSK